MSEQPQKRGRGRPSKASSMPIPASATPPNAMRFAPVPPPIQEEDDDIASILQQIHDNEQQMARDAELARQLAEEENPPHAPGDQGDDMDSIMEQIQQMEAAERLKQHGNAYAQPLNLDRLMAQQDAQDEEIRRQVQQKSKNAEWQAEKMQQDWEYEQALAEQSQQQSPVPPVLPQQVQAPPAIEPVVDIPKTREEMRLARLKFFNNK